MDHPHIFRPTPRRAFEITPASSESSAVHTPSREPSNLSQSELKANDSIPPDRTRSILNLTSSTLFGIYEPSRHETLSGTGSRTLSIQAGIDDSKPPVIGAYERPRLQRSHSQHHPTFRETTLSVVPRTILLFIFGVAYGIIITHLHDDQRLAPVKIEGIQRYSWQYLGFWGIAGVALGGLLPWVDLLWEEDSGGLGDEDTDGKKAMMSASDAEERPVSRSGSGMAADWNPAVRSVGAFVGIAFAIVCVPSTLDRILLTCRIAEAPLAIDIPSLTHTRPRQPGTLVPHRPLETGLSAIRTRRSRRHRYITRHQPECRPTTCVSVTEGRTGYRFTDGERIRRTDHA